MENTCMKIGDNNAVNVCFVVASPPPQTYTEAKAITDSSLDYDHKIMVSIQNAVKLHAKSKIRSSNKKVISVSSGAIGKTANEQIVDITNKSDFVVFIASASLLSDNVFLKLFDYICEVNNGSQKRIECVYVVSRTVAINTLPQPENKHMFEVLPFDWVAIQTYPSETQQGIINGIAAHICSMVENHRNEITIAKQQAEIDRLNKELSAYQNFISQKK